MGIGEKYKMNISAKWTGLYPSLCCGHWEIVIDGEHLPIPADKDQEPMNTFKIYSHWYFDSHMSEQTEYYENGIEENEWITANKGWIDAGLAQIGKRFLNYKDYSDLYQAIQGSDFRRGSCGGCI